MTPEQFVEKWKGAKLSERAPSHEHFIDLCHLLDQPTPAQSDPNLAHASFFRPQAKGGRDKISMVQIIQDFALCREKFPQLICRPIAAQFMEDEVISLFEFEESKKGFAIAGEKHYRLVPPDPLTPEELETYRRRSE